MDIAMDFFLKVFQYRLIFLLVLFKEVTTILINVSPPLFSFFDK